MNHQNFFKTRELIKVLNNLARNWQSRVKRPPENCTFTEMKENRFDIEE